MLERRRARRAALEVLYQSDILSIPVARIIGEKLFLRPDMLPEFSDRLARGVAERQSEVDELISTYADNWTIDRMPTVDRNILRLATYELLAEPEIPPSVSINEAVELAKVYGTEESSKFVNGLLGRIAEELGHASGESRQADTLEKEQR